MKSAILFYRKLVVDLTYLGFEINPYDPCVANKIINGKQMTIVWHVDDLLVSHAESSEVDTILTWLGRGPTHDYLGMTLDFKTNRSLVVGMDAYIHKIIQEFPEHISGTAPSPAADHLY